MLRSSSVSASVSPFTVSQWQELEHQALIYKYLMAGLAIPPDLVVPIQKSFEAVSSRFFTHPTMGYCSFYGKKYDPEPGRCRRTDGKKWRCSKDAYPDSKYCERHMHRGRNRSRKPVESPQTVSQLASSSTVNSLNVGGSVNRGTASTTTTGFPSLPLQAFGGNLQSGGGLNSSTNPAHFNEDHIPFGIPSKDYRSIGLKPETGEHNFFADATDSNRSLRIENAWSMLPSQVSSFPSSKPGNDALLLNEYTQSSLFSLDFAPSDSGKQGNSLRPFFDEWPKARESWSALEEERSNQGSYSTTHLSMSIPVGSIDFSATSSQSPNVN